MKSKIKALTCLLISMVGLGRALATEVVPLSLDETVRQADLIVLGQATAKQSRWRDASKRWILTDYTFTIEDALYDRPNQERADKSIVLTYWGGTIDGETHSISDMELPVIGRRQILMLHSEWRHKPGFTPVVGFSEGVFTVSSDGPDKPHRVHSADGQPLVLTGKGGVLRARDYSAKAKASAADLPTFKQWLKSNVHAIKSKQTELAPLVQSNDPRVLTTFAKTPERIGASGLSAFSDVAARDPSQDAGIGAIDSPPLPPSSPSLTGADEVTSRASLAGYSFGHIAHLPIVVNNLPDSYAPWSPEDEYQMSKWNHYGNDVFRVSPTDSYGWGDGHFDLVGWPSSTDLQNTYGEPWGATTLGVCFRRYDSGGWLIEADIAMNPAYSWTLDDEWVYNGGSARSFRRTMTHELGHMHGLDHQFNYLSVMNYPPAEFRAFSFPYTDDAEGIRAEYPANAVNRTDLAVYLHYASGYQSVSDATIPGSVTAGEVLTVNNYQVENVGTTTIGTPTIEWYLTTARNFSSSYYYLGVSTYPSLGRFSYFTPSTVQRSFQVPTSVPSGAYYLAAFIRDDSSPGQASFPFDNNRAFSRAQITVRPPPPVNDGFAARRSLNGLTGATTGNNSGATREAGEPDHYTAGGKSVWWQWTAPANGLATFNTEGSSFDTLLAVYTGNSIYGLSLVASDDDSGSGVLSQVSFSAVAGTTYDIAVDGFSGANGSITLNWSLRDAEPPLLDCPGNIVLAANAGQCARNVTYIVSATDNSPGVTVLCDPPSGTSFGVGTRTVQCVATDTAGNASRCSFPVTVTEAVSPSLAIIPGNRWVAVVWTVSCTEYVLERSSSVDMHAGWVPYSGTIERFGNDRVTMVPTVGSASFFRLVSPRSE
jgi:hypothetical protein